MAIHQIIDRKFITFSLSNEETVQLQKAVSDGKWNSTEDYLRFLLKKHWSTTPKLCKDPLDNVLTRKSLTRSFKRAFLGLKVSFELTQCITCNTGKHTAVHLHFSKGFKRDQIWEDKFNEVKSRVQKRLQLGEIFIISFESV